jgi:uncharacterized protein DUF4114
MSTAGKQILRVAMAGVLVLAGSQAYAACTFGGQGGEPSLQGTLNSMFGAGAPNAQLACVADGTDGAWSTVGSITQIDIVLELAGNAQSNTFGLYDLNNPNHRLTIFEGNDGAAAEATLRLRQLADGTWRASVLELNNPDDPSGWTTLNGLTTSAFGFYLGTAANGTFFSQTSRNADSVDHMYAYRGNGAAFVGGPMAGELFTPQDFVLAWEDLMGGGDLDYQDFVVVVQDIRPVPLPAALWLLVSGMMGLAGVARRRR